jgi:hypothetical protein
MKKYDKHFYFEGTHEFFIIPTVSIIYIRDLFLESGITTPFYGFSLKIFNYVFTAGIQESY